MTCDNTFPGAKKNAALAEVAALVTSEAIALCDAVLPNTSGASHPVLQRAMRQAHEVKMTVSENRTDERTATWALEVAAVALSEARREVALDRV